MNIYKNIAMAGVGVFLLITSCTKDLNTSPIDSSVETSDKIFADTKAYSELLSKCYGGLVLTGLGSHGGWGDPELANGDEGVTSFLRVYWSAQELPTDEAVNSWGDGDLDEYHKQQWSDANSYNFMLYKRIFYNITVCNSYIKTVTPRYDGLTGTLKEDVKHYLAEARFLRSLFYYFAMDLWGNVPFVTESDNIGAFMPKQINRAELFTYIEKELKETAPLLPDPSTSANTYGRATKAAAWQLLAKMYLNAEVYLGTSGKKYNECATYCDSIIKSGIYSLHQAKGSVYSGYQELFLSDNGENAREEIIFPITCDANFTQNYGGTTFIVHAAIGGNIPASLMGTGGWGGNMTTSAFSNRFPDASGNTDKRALFFAPSQVKTATLSAMTGFNDAYGITKWRNFTSNGDKSSGNDFMNNDFPLFRLADVYLMYIEAVLRGATTGTLANSLSYVNLLRQRAYGNTSGNISGSDLTLDFILDERGRELYWEGHRRTDLIRFGKFTSGTYVWDWKGNIKSGVETDAHLNLFPIPAQDRSVNSNLSQNAGY